MVRWRVFRKVDIEGFPWNLLWSIGMILLFQGIFSMSAEEIGTGGTSPSVWLDLESIVEGPDVLYPGQQIRVGYRYRFNHNIQLVEEELPLFESGDFEKVGSPEVLDEKVVQESTGSPVVEKVVLQRLKALRSGTYEFPAAEIAGYPYVQDSKGNPIYLRSQLVAHSVPITVVVTPFPEEGKPLSFQGAVGQFSFSVRLLSFPRAQVGDKMTLALEIGGTGDLESVEMPDLCCQPGFSGRFAQSDIPPIGVLKSGKKFFVIDLRPLSSTIREIPSIAFSFFDPIGNVYRELRSAPIPIDVYSEEGAPDESFAVPSEKIEHESRIPPRIPLGDAVSNEPLGISDLQELPFSSPWTLLLLPLGSLLLGYQWYSRRSLREEKGLTLEETAFLADPVPDSVEGRLLRALSERGWIARGTSYRELAGEGILGEVRAFLEELEMGRFRPHPLSSEQILHKERELYAKIVSMGFRQTTSR